MVLGASCIGAPPLHSAGNSAGCKTSSLLMQLPPSIRRNSYVPFDFLQGMVSLNAARKDVDICTVCSVILTNSRETPDTGHVRPRKTSKANDAVFHETANTENSGYHGRPPRPIQSLLPPSKGICTETRQIFFSESTIGANHSRKNSLTARARRYLSQLLARVACGRDPAAVFCEDRRCTHLDF